MENRRPSIIKTPQVYKAADIKEGNKAVIHILQPEQTFIHLSFNEEKEKQSKVDDIFQDELYEIKDNEQFKKQFEKIEKRILTLDGVYTSYNYLFSVVKEQAYLFFVTISNIPLGFKATKDIARKINIPVISPSWKGVYTHLVPHAFYEDIFIQPI